MRRFYSSTPLTSPTVILDDDEAHHLLHVLRAEVGDEVVLFDGSGAEFAARVSRCGKRQIELEILSRAEVDRELSRQVTLGIALPKGDRQRWLVEKAVELGAARLVPLETERGVAQPQPQVLERLRRAVIEASKQCGRNRLMEIGEAKAWSDWRSALPAGAVRLVAHPGLAGSEARIAAKDLREILATTSGEVFLAIGPEGGFSDNEIAGAVGAGWRCLSLGKSILRVETAALTAMAQIAGAMGG